MFTFRPKHNPPSISAQAATAYRAFHGVEPDDVTLAEQVWVPGSMVLIGAGADIGYEAKDRRSTKEGWYVHDFGHAVKIYRRAGDRERASRTWRSFPRDLIVLGYNLGFTFRGPGGKLQEVHGSRSKFLACTPSRKTLVIVGPSGVEYLAEGGRMRVADWIRD